ncbi:MAG: isochorismatase [Patescibacteria group bacterium]|jgi:nicotinamidase-related amidase
MSFKQLPLPSHYAPDQNFDENYYPNTAQLLQQAEEWRKKHDVKPAAGDKRRLTVLSIDCQNDFTWLSGALPVLGRSGKGSMEAQQRGVEWGYRYLHMITSWKNSMDFHPLFQMSSVTGHVRKDDGSHPVANVPITLDEYRQNYRPNPAMCKMLRVDPLWLERQFLFYIEELAKHGKPLEPWGLHCLAGDRGAALTGGEEAFRLFHAFVRGAHNTVEVKGTSPLTEHYSILRPLVMRLFDGRPIPGVQKNTLLINDLATSDVVVAKGLASSHCVDETVNDFLTEIMAIDPKLVEKVYIMRDCTAPVVIPNVVDFTDKAEAAFAKFEAAGMHVVESTTPIEDWPGINL